MLKSSTLSLPYRKLARTRITKLLRDKWMSSSLCVVRE